MLLWVFLGFRVLLGFVLLPEDVRLVNMGLGVLTDGSALFGLVSSIIGLAQPDTRKVFPAIGLGLTLAFGLLVVVSIGLLMLARPGG